MWQRVHEPGKSQGAHGALPGVQASRVRVLRQEIPPLGQTQAPQAKLFTGARAIQVCLQSLQQTF